MVEIDSLQITEKPSTKYNYSIFREKRDDTTSMKEVLFLKGGEIVQKTGTNSVTAKI